MLHEEVERIKRVVRKKTSTGSGALSFTVTWGTEIPSDAFAFIIDSIWVASTQATGGITEDVQVSVDGGATLYMLLTQSGYMGPVIPPYGLPVFKTDGTIALPVITITTSNPASGTHQLFMVGHWIYAGG